MAGSPSELLRTSDHLKGVPEATEAHWAAIRAEMGRSCVAGSKEDPSADQPKTLAEQVYSD